MWPRCGHRVDNVFTPRVHLGTVSARCRHRVDNWGDNLSSGRVSVDINSTLSLFFANLLTPCRQNTYTASTLCRHLIFPSTFSRHCVDMESTHRRQVVELSTECRHCLNTGPPGRRHGGGRKASIYPSFAKLPKFCPFVDTVSTTSRHISDMLSSC